MLILLFRIPHFAVGVDVFCRGGGVYKEVVATEFFVKLENRFIAAEIEQAVEGVFDVNGIATAGTQDVIHDWGVCQYGFLIQGLKSLG